MLYHAIWQFEEAYRRPSDVIFYNMIYFRYNMWKVLIREGDLIDMVISEEGIWSIDSIAWNLVLYARSEIDNSYLSCQTKVSSFITQKACWIMDIIKVLTNG